MASSTPATGLKQRMLQVRHDAIVDTVNGLLAAKGYDLMTVDEVAAEVGIAKASLYKHFPSKEVLASAAMKRLQRQALARIEQLDAQDGDAQHRLRELVRWALLTQYEGQMPSLPSENSALREVLLADKEYVSLLTDVSDRIGVWIVRAQKDRSLNPALPPEVVLFTLFARACDPVLPMLKAAGHPRDRIVEWMLATCFGGLCGTSIQGGAAAPRATSRPQVKKGR